MDKDRMKKKLRFRKLNEWWAHFWHYFWASCPLCGKYFGGHEVGGGMYGGIPIKDEPGRSTCVCPECEYRRSKSMELSDVIMEADKAWGSEYRRSLSEFKTEVDFPPFNDCESDLGCRCVIREGLIRSQCDSHTCQYCRGRNKSFPVRPDDGRVGEGSSPTETRGG